MESTIPIKLEPSEEIQEYQESVSSKDELLIKVESSELDKACQFEPKNQQPTYKMAKNLVLQEAWAVTSNGKYFERDTQPVVTPWTTIADPAQITMMDTTVFWITPLQSTLPTGPAQTIAHTFKVDPYRTTIKQNGCEFTLKQNGGATKEYLIVIFNEPIYMALRRRLQGLGFDLD